MPQRRISLRGKGNVLYPVLCSCILYCIGIHVNKICVNTVAFGELPGVTDASNSCPDTLHTRLLEGQRTYI